MVNRDITPTLYKKELIYFYQSDSHKWFIDEISLIRIFKIDKDRLIKIQEKLEKDRHFVVENIEDIRTKSSDEVTLWSRKGVIKIAYLLNSPVAFDVVDNLEDVELKKREPIFGELEDIFQERLVEIKKDGSFSDIETFIGAFSKFIKEREIFTDKKKMGIKSMFLDLFEDALKTVQK